MSSFSVFLVKAHLAVPYLWDKLLSIPYRKSMAHCGRNVRLRPSSSDYKGLWNLSVGDNCILPKNTVIYCTVAPVTIGSNVIFGPHPTIISGDHRTDISGVNIIDVEDKLPENDQAVIIEDNVWAGANVTILKGVTIGAGSIIGAGAVVTRSCPPNSVIGGVPATIIRNRFE